MKKLILLIYLSLISSAFADNFAQQLVDAAKTQIGVTLGYDPGYIRIPYPNGDVPLETGVCTDVIIRAYRKMGIDLQKEVHEDMKKNFAKYPRIWGLSKPDTNIDHRRVPNLQVFFERHGKSLPLDKDFQAGDIVTWNLSPKGGSIPHIGIVSGDNFVIHNMGYGTLEQSILFSYEITGHYRYNK